MYFGSMKQRAHMFSKFRYLLIILCIPFCASAQTSDFTEWQKNYPDLIWNFEKNLEEPLSGKLSRIPDTYFSTDTLPAWLFTWNLMKDNSIYSIGVSDPFINSDKATQQAYNRAIFLLSMQIFSVVNGMNEYYSRTDDENKERNDAFTQFYQIFSKSNIKDSLITLAEKTTLKTGECVIKLKYPLDASFLQSFNTYVNTEWYSQEKSLNLDFESVQKLVLTGNTITKNGLSELCAFSYKKFNEKDEVLSECPDNSEYYVQTFNYYFGSKQILSTQGLWTSILNNYLKKMINSCQLSNETIKKVSDGYQKLNNNLSREIILKQSDFFISYLDSNLLVYIYKEPVADNSIHDIKEGSVVTWHDNGVKKEELYYTNDLLDGVQREWTSNEHLISEISYNNGVLNGFYQTWYENLQPKESLYYKNGKPYGEHLTWYDDGRPKLTEGFDENGLLTGNYEERYSNGWMKSSGKYKNGLKKGLWKYYDENRKVKREYYKKGKKILG